MTPIDDELRSLLHHRADAVAPAPDPLSGIERRAKRMRRNQLAAAVAGSALVVAAVAVAVPTLVPDRHSTGTVATTPTPSVSVAPSPTAAGTYGPNELDPEHPWAYRGLERLAVPTELSSLQAEWSAKHPGSTLTPLFGQVYEPSNADEVVFVSSAPYRWGVATSSHAGWEFTVDNELPSHSSVLMTALPGDEVARLLILAAPSTGDISYAKDGATWRTVVGSDAGVAFVPLEGDTSQDKVRVLDGDGDQDHPVFEGPAPDYGGPTSGPASDAKPLNYLDWMSRSTTYPVDDSKVRFMFAQAMGRPADSAKAVYHALYTGKDGQITYTVGQAWFKGDTEAHTFGWASGTDNGNEVFLGPVTPKGSQLVAYVVSRPSKGTDLLVVIPRPGAGSVSYAPDGTSPYVQKANGRSDLNPVALIDRDPKASNDRVQVLDGDGMKVLYDGPVAPLVCGVSGCG